MWNNFLHGVMGFLLAIGVSAVAIGFFNLFKHSKDDSKWQ